MIAAFGVTVYSSIPGSTYTTLSGTSMATSMVTGAFAILRSADPGATVDQLIAALQAIGQPLVDAASGTTKPLIQIDRAVRSLLRSAAALVSPAAVALPRLALERRWLVLPEWAATGRCHSLLSVRMATPIALARNAGQLARTFLYFNALGCAPVETDLR
jgi:hypothetical protein